MRQSPEDLHLIGSSPVFLDLMDRVSQVAVLERPVLVVGERGTGKELVASRLHFLSRRWDANFVKLNCAALPETLLESELFGYEPGAFTGATHRRPGRFEQADGGTLFLDEIATMSASAQEKLLRVIEYGEFERLGGSQTIRVNTRVIGATNVDLPAAANAGLFRHDLLDRLAFDVLTVPPLRARQGDIMELAIHFGRAMASELDWPKFPGFTQSAEKALKGWKWPGNIRELRNVAERATALSQSAERQIDSLVFDPFDSPWRPDPAHGTLVRESTQTDDDSDKKPGRPDASGVDPGSSGPYDFRSAVDKIERQLLETALQRNRFNQRQTAQFLNLSYDQLRHALKKHELL